jgi:uncharacterized membrane-anchored protein YitT (DUF2179 family)
MPKDDAPPPPSLTRALLSWVGLSVVFVAGGGLGAGIVALLYEAVVGTPFGDVLYAVIFGGIGLVAYRTARASLRRRRRGRRAS